MPPKMYSITQDCEARSYSSLGVCHRLLKRFDKSLGFHTQVPPHCYHHLTPHWNPHLSALTISHRCPRVGEVEPSGTFWQWLHPIVNAPPLFTLFDKCFSSLVDWLESGYCVIAITVMRFPHNLFSSTVHSLHRSSLNLKL